MIPHHEVMGTIQVIPQICRENKVILALLHVVYHKYLRLWRFVPKFALASRIPKQFRIYGKRIKNQEALLKHQTAYAK
jgi:hypothetical protein